MASEDTEIVRKTCELWSRGELDATLELITPDASWELSGKFIGTSESYRGHAGIQRFWATFREPWTDISLEPIEFEELDERRLLTRTRFRGTGKTSSVQTETELYVIWTLAGDKVSRYQSFGSRDEALEAAGDYENSSQRSSAGSGSRGEPLR